MEQFTDSRTSLRAIAGLTLTVLRPGGAEEVVEAFRFMRQLRHWPAVLVLSHQILLKLDRSKYATSCGLSRGTHDRVS